VECHGVASAEFLELSKANVTKTLKRTCPKDFAVEAADLIFYRQHYKKLFLTGRAIGDPH